MPNLDRCIQQLINSFRPKEKKRSFLASVFVPRCGRVSVRMTDFRHDLLFIFGSESVFLLRELTLFCTPFSKVTAYRDPFTSAIYSFLHRIMQSGGSPMYEGCRLPSGLSVSAEAPLLDSDCSDLHLIVDLKRSRNPLDPAVPICLWSCGSCPFSSTANPLSGILM